jgi:hypothetical protein
MAKTEGYIHRSPPLPQRVRVVIDGEKASNRFADDHRDGAERGPMP